MFTNWLMNAQTNPQVAGTACSETLLLLSAQEGTLGSAMPQGGCDKDGFYPSPISGKRPSHS